MIVLKGLWNTWNLKDLKVMHYLNSLGGSTYVRLTSQDSKWHCILAIQVHYFRIPTHLQGEKMKMLSSKLFEEGKMFLKNQQIPITNIGK